MKTPKTEKNGPAFAPEMHSVDVLVILRYPRLLVRKCLLGHYKVRFLNEVPAVAKARGGRLKGYRPES